MSLFLTEIERERLKTRSRSSASSALFSAMQARVRSRVSTPGLDDRSATTQWWHHVAEYLTDAALVHAIEPSPETGAWLRDAVLAIVRRPSAEWSGPPFRGYTGGERVGSLETGHLTWSIAITLDLAGDIFTAEEYEEIAATLHTQGLLPCRRFLERTNFCHNWNCVLLAGFAVAAAVLGDDDALAEAVAWFPLAADHFQPDGSYGESLQYANYAAYSLVLAREAIVRRSPSSAPPTLEPYARMVHWAAQALFYRKPLSGWGEVDRARSANFGDSAALFRPSGDLLIHIAARGKQSLPAEAGLARWLFDTLYLPAHEPPPHDLASFGFLPGFGFLSVILLPDAAAPLSPRELQLPTVATFSGGDAFARDAWDDGLTILAARTASQPRHATAHIHGDVNSFILVHRHERLLVDPGHSCYRNLGRELEIASSTHNTCTFEVARAPSAANLTLTQRSGSNRPIVRENNTIRGDAPIPSGGRQLLSARLGPVSVIASEAAPIYGAPLRTFTRHWLLCGSHVLFIVDRIESEEPLRTTWHWLLNNRDGLLDLRLAHPDRLIARRGDAGLVLTHFGAGQMSGPIYAHVHDAYHPLPAQRGEGRPGSGQLVRWTESQASTARTVVHAICVDSAAAAHGWNINSGSNTFTLDAPDRREQWTLRTDAAGNMMGLEERVTGQAFAVSRDSNGEWQLVSGVSSSGARIHR